MVKFLGRKLLFVVAHPDDESFTSSGTMYLNRQKGGENYIFCATLGERGKSHLKQPVTDAQLKKMRENEVQKAAKFLKVRGLFFGRAADTKVKDSHTQLLAKVSRLITTIQPDYIFSFGPDGISGHLDHIAIGQVARAAAKQARLPFVAFAASPRIRKNFSQITKRRAHGKYAATVKHALPNLKIPIDGKIKQKILNFHKSQAGPSTLSASLAAAVRRGILAYEYFII